jgi:hypothetical protein
LNSNDFNLLGGFITGMNLFVVAAEISQPKYITASNGNPFCTKLSGVKFVTIPI